MESNSNGDCAFTFRHYRAILEGALQSGYAFHEHLTYWRQRPSGRSILLRHDIDNFMKRAVEFGKIEASLGLKATYFVRIHGEYNPFYVNDYLRLMEIQKLGHELALHSDVLEFAALTGQSDRAEELLVREIRFLEAALGTKVYGIATHRDLNSDAPNSMPWVSSLDLSRFGLEYDGYHPTFIRERKYVSEKVNRGIGWWDKCACKFIGAEDRLTILTHPRWWYHQHFYED